MKEKLITQAKMIIYGVLPLKVANKVIEEARYVHLVFGGFIIGKLLDSLIIGVMSFVLLNFMNMPYVLLVSVITVSYTHLDVYKRQLLLHRDRRVLRGHELRDRRGLRRCGRLLWRQG